MNGNGCDPVFGANCSNMSVKVASESWLASKGHPRRAEQLTATCQTFERTSFGASGETCNVGQFKWGCVEKNFSSTQKFPLLQTPGDDSWKTPNGRGTNFGQLEKTILRDLGCNSWHYTAASFAKIYQIIKSTSFKFKNIPRTSSDLALNLADQCQEPSIIINKHH